MPQAYRHNPRKPSAIAVAAVRERNTARVAVAALTTLILSVVLTLLAQAGWMPLI